MQPTPLVAACLAAGLGLGLAGCGPNGLPGADVTRLIEPDLSYGHGPPPPGTDPSACYGKDVSPAVIETVTDQILLQPAEIDAEGRVLYPAVYKTETRQAIVKERREIWFETPCAEVLTPEFVASLQRALKVRGVYRGPVTGAMTGWTRRAVRAYQRDQGLDSAILSMAAARQLGLVAYARPAE